MSNTDKFFLPTLIMAFSLALIIIFSLTGCDEVIDSTKNRAKVERIFASLDFKAYEMVHEDIVYIIVRDTHGISITKKR